MKNSINHLILNYINDELDSFKILVDADNEMGLNIGLEEILNYLEFAYEENSLKRPIVGNILITEGDILSVLKIINDLTSYKGEYILYINEDNIGINTYLVDRANKIYASLDRNVKIIIDYNENYNKYLNEKVNVIGSKDFIATASSDFTNKNIILI